MKIHQQTEGQQRPQARKAHAREQGPLLPLSASLCALVQLLLTPHHQAHLHQTAELQAGRQLWAWLRVWQQQLTRLQAAGQQSQQLQQRVCRVPVLPKKPCLTAW